MQWDDSPHAGFTTGNTPWMRVNDNYKAINAASQTSNPRSVYHTWRQVLEKRKALKDIFVYGDFALVDGNSGGNERIFAYKRTVEDGSGRSALVVCNFSREEVTWVAPGEMQPKEVLLSTTDKTKLAELGGSGSSGEIKLGACEAVVLLL